MTQVIGSGDTVIMLSPVEAARQHVRDAAARVLDAWLIAEDGSDLETALRAIEDGLDVYAEQLERILAGLEAPHE